ncbi:PAS domain S-box protein [Rubrivivax albus]|uniref:PAS domain S-box protein n=1 Tax=Rubrivivax albus TaxID=2499835 RepID=UPI0013050D90|nr:PAS domain S-box protein [Rubrivivax albus]
MLWAAPYPALIEDSGGRLIDVNEAFAQFCGYTREHLRGRELVSLQPAEDQATARRRRVQGEIDVGDQRLLDAAGLARWYRQTRTPLGDHGLVVSVLQDTTSEHAARAQADRTSHELAQWFDLSPAGMLVFDASGLIVRSNRTFEALIGQVPVTLEEAPLALQALLAWDGRAPSAGLVPGAPPMECQALVEGADGRRRLSARVSAFATDQGQLRYMAVVEDLSAEDERDLALLEIGALMDTAGIFVATYDPARGWLRSAGAVRGGVSPPPTTALQGIARDIVEPSSLPEYEKLQAALRGGTRAEVRYAVRHPELGQRWLLTRVEPGALAGGRRATSVVTIDVTDRERAQRRNEQLLRELGTILEGSPAGIALLRGDVLQRCNRRFERMLDLAEGAGPGATLQSLLALTVQGAPLARSALSSVLERRDFDAELQLPGGRWYALSLRASAAEAGDALSESVAVLSDITRLKSQQAELQTLARERELMFAHSAVGIAWQRGARIERANQALADLTGWSVPELTALDGAELYPSTRECVDFERALAEGLARDGVFVGERRLRRRDGRALWVQVAARPVSADAGSGPDAGMVCSFVDVDERHRARESLQRQAEQTRAVLDSVLVGIVTVADDAIVWMNRPARRMFGGELTDFTGEPIHVVATAEADHPLRRTDWTSRLADGQSETFECRLRGRDGREFWVVGNVVQTVRDGGGRQLTFALLDIDSRRQAEVSIARAKASLQRLIETVPLAIALVDGPTRRPLQTNPAADAFLAAPPAGLDGAVAQAPQRLELRDAEGRLWDTRTVPLSAVDGGPAELLLVASDVTEQRAADLARLQAAIAQREVLVREVHHRIKNNLQGVAGLLQQYAARHAEVAPVLGEAVSQVQAIAQVYGLQVGASGPLRLARVVEAIVQSVQRTFGREIGFEGGAGALAFELPEAEAIPIALVVNELLTNAVKHGGGTVRCRVMAEPDGDAAVVDIRHAGQLPEAFDLARFPGGVSGLGLVRALLPRRSATLSLEQVGEEVLTRVRLSPPSVRRDAGAAGVAATIGASNDASP